MKSTYKLTMGFITQKSDKWFSITKEFENCTAAEAIFNLSLEGHRTPLKRKDVVCGEFVLDMEDITNNSNVSWPDIFEAQKQAYELFMNADF